MRKMFLLLLALCVATLSYGQSMILNPQDPVKLDSLVRIGHLDNGLTYFIRHNANPEHRAEFYIATDVGAINETPEQRGLAHFLEHMCFNGNKDFPSNTMMSYLEKNGLVFGANINAMTGVEQTIYILQTIPTERKAMVDTALVILQNDAAYVTNDPKEVEKERGVIVEEWRSGNTSQRRMYEDLMKYLFKGTKYASCNVIGDDKCILGFDPKDLVNYYKTWYYPANQAIIVCGDIDPDYVEAKIKELFGAIPKKENPPVKEVIKVTENDEPIVEVYSDPEISNAQAMVMIKMDPLDENYKPLGIGVLNNLIKSMISQMASERMTDASKEPGSTFSGPYAGFNNMAKTMDVFMYASIPAEGKGAASVGDMIKVIRQIKEYGFTQAEFDRAKANLLRQYQSEEDKAATRTNGQLAMQYVNYFLEKEPFADPAYMNSVAKQYMDQVNLKMINMTVKELLSSKNNVIFYSCPKKEGVVIPTNEEIAAASKAAFSAEVKPMANNEVMEPLIDAAKIKGGKVVKESKGFMNSTVLKLSNGLEVYLYPTEIQKDKVVLNMFQMGGKSVLPVNLLPVFEENIFASYQSNSGVAKFSESKLEKIISGKDVAVSNFVGDCTSGISGSSSSKDFETMMQLTYLYYTQPRCDSAEYAVGMAPLKSFAVNMESSPEIKFYQESEKVSTNNSPRAMIISKEMIAKANAADTYKGLKELFNNAAGSYIFLVGDFKIEEVKPLIAKYMGALPAKAEKSRTFVNHKMFYAPGENEKVFDFKMKNPNTTVSIVYSGKMARNHDNSLQLRAMTYVMDMRYIQSLREEEGGTYSPSVDGSITTAPEENYIFSVDFETQFEKSKKLIDMTHRGLEDLAANGPTDEEMKKTIETFKKNIPESKKRVGYYLNKLSDYYAWGKDMTDSEDAINKNVTRENIQKMAQLLVNNKNRSEVIMNPAK